MFGSFNADLSRRASRRARGQARRFAKGKRPKPQRDQTASNNKEVPRSSPGTNLLAAVPSSHYSLATELGQGVVVVDHARTIIDEAVDDDRIRKRLKRRAPESSVGTKSSFSFKKWIRSMTSEASAVDSNKASEGTPSGKTASRKAWPLSSLIAWFGMEYPQRSTRAAQSQLSHPNEQPGALEAQPDNMDGETTQDGVQVKSGNFSSPSYWPDHRIPIQNDGVEGRGLSGYDFHEKGLLESQYTSFYDTRSANAVAALQDLVSYRRDPIELAASGRKFVDETIQGEEAPGIISKLGFSDRYMEWGEALDGATGLGEDSVPKLHRASSIDSTRLFYPQPSLQAVEVDQYSSFGPDYRPWVLDRAREWEQALDDAVELKIEIQPMLVSRRPELTDMALKDMSPLD